MTSYSIDEKLFLLLNLKRCFWAFLLQKVVTDPRNRPHFLLEMIGKLTKGDLAQGLIPQGKNPH